MTLSLLDWVLNSLDGVATGVALPGVKYLNELFIGRDGVFAGVLSGFLSMSVFVFF